jgi:DNA polymerase
MQDLSLPKVYGDFETRCDLDLKEVGAEKYLRHPSADILFYTYKIEYPDGRVTKTDVWYAGDVPPRFFTHPNEFMHYEFNNQFDMRVKRYLGAKYGILEPSLDNMIDVMALCGRYTFPQKLEDAAKIVNPAGAQKGAGLALIKKICSPPYKYTHTDFQNFVAYGIGDTDSMYGVVKNLPLDHLSEDEHKIWKLTVRINQRGIPLDMKGIKSVLKCASAYQKQGVLDLRTKTRGRVQTPGQIQKIKDFLNKEFGLNLPNLQADTLDKLLEDPAIPEGAKEIMQLRKDLGPAAVKKFKKLADVAIDGRCYDNLRYYGAHTGRWSGMGFQLQNLPRVKSKAPHALLRSFHDGSIMQRGSVIVHSRKLVRHMLRAPDGFLLCVNDFSSIENRFLAWFTDDQKSLQLFREGGDQYKDMASSKFGVAYEDVDDYQRFVGKVIILGCGYGMGGSKFQSTAAGYGLMLSEAEATEAVIAYRNKYPEVPKMWYGTYSAAIAAIRHPGKTFRNYKCQFRVIADHTKRRWLQLRLPNGTCLYYCEPYLEGDFRPQICYAGINSYTKKWDTKKRIIPGLLVENIIQAIAREYMAEGAIALDNSEYDIGVLGLVHDEALNLLHLETIHEMGGKATGHKIGEIMCYQRDWCPDLPMSADGYISKHYKKD